MLSILAYFIAKFMGMCFDARGIKIICQWGMIFFGFLNVVALFGLSGWERQTWGGNSKPERLNSWLNSITCCATYLFAVMAVFI